MGIKMYRLCLCIALLGVVVASPTFKSLGDLKIVGGDDIDISEAPYQVSLTYYGRHHCGGALVANDLVITAAHCVMDKNPRNYKIRAGATLSSSGGELFSVGELIGHEGFSYNEMDNDIAVVWLSDPITFNENITAIDMYKQDEEINDGEETIVTGWGHINEGGPYPSQFNLQLVKVRKVNDGFCKDAYGPRFTISPMMLCAGVPEGGKDACQGDSGGPLVYNNKLAGVVSWGLGCARPDYPGVYAKVSALRPWLDEQILYLRLKHVLRMNL